MRDGLCRAIGPVRRPAFTLIEVILALTIASVGVCYMCQALSLCTASMARRQFFTKCADFLNQRMEGVVMNVGVSGGSDSGQVPGPGPEVGYVAETKDGDYPTLKLITITFTSKDPRIPLQVGTVTCYTSVMKVRKDDDSGGGGGK